jgi:cytochrome P450
LSQRDWFTDEAIVNDPYPYLASLRDKCPVASTNRPGVLAVTGYDEAGEVFRNADVFSACATVAGPFIPFPEPLEGDVGAVIDRHRDVVPGADSMVTMDPPQHTRERSLIMRLFTPLRLRQNEGFIRQVADEQIDGFAESGHCELISQLAQPLATMVIVDLLGVPKADHAEFREGFKLHSGRTGDIHDPGARYAGDSNKWLDRWFTGYIEDRRANPRDDIMSSLATAKYPDGSTPPIEAVVRTSTFLFAAGQETSARMMAQALRFLAVHPELQDRLRAEPELIPNFIEETLRIESPTKTDFRLAREDTTIAGVEVPAGTYVGLLLGGINHDPRRFECPDEFRADRPNAREHLAFGRGIHSCPGAPLARAEGRICVERMLARTRNIRLAPAHHGPDGEPRFEYEPTWMLRAMETLHLEFDPA